MKKAYQKPILRRRESLGSIAAISLWGPFQPT